MTEQATTPADRVGFTELRAIARAQRPKPTPSRAKPRVVHNASRYVYVFVLRESGRVKIGIAADPYMRLETLQTANPEEVCFLGYREPENPRALEAELHERFAGSWIRGEWFEWSAEIEAYVGELLFDWDALKAATIDKRPPRIRRPYRGRP